MSDAPEVRTVRAKLIGITGDEEYSLTQFTINIAVNAIPSVEVKGNRVGKSVGAAQSVESGDVAGSSGVSVPRLLEYSSQEQNKIWRADKPPILKLEVMNDGKGQSAYFEGFCTSPRVRIGGTQVIETRRLIHQDFALSDIDMSIYDFDKETGLDPYNPPENTDPNGEEHVCKDHIKSLVEWILLKNDFKRRHIQASAEATQYYIDIDEKNKKELYPEVLRPILEKSDDTALKAGAAGGEFQHQTYRTSLLRTILGSSNMLSMLQNWMCPNFMFQHIANWDVAPGKSYFEHAQNNALPERTEFLDTTRCNIEMGEQLSMGTIGQIEFMSGSATEYGGEGAGVKDNSANISENIIPGSAWPIYKTPKWGRLERYTLPSWGILDHTPKEEKDPLESPLLNGVNRNALAEAQKTRDRIKAQGQKHITKFSKFLLNWAKKKYTIDALKEAKVVLEMPLDISWGCDERGDGILTGGNPKSVGQTYSIYEAGSGEFLFDGYLHNVTHNVVLGEKNGSATTTLVFTNTKGVRWRSEAEFQPKYGCAPWVLPEV